MKLLCLSNGHGEDEVAVRILQELQNLGGALEVAALPIVGEGRAYAKVGIPLWGSVRLMPSGGFIYMDGRQVVRDLKGGLLQLTWQQLQVVRAWGQQGGVILAVGDIVPLLFAWWSGTSYAFVGTAKSEYYLRDETGALPRVKQWQRWEGWSGSVYLPWERWLMCQPGCKAVFPRDRLTTSRLQRWNISAFDLGNPMMDHLEPQNKLDLTVTEQQYSLIILMLPGSRPPEAYKNWQLMTTAVSGLIQTFESILFLAAIAPGLDLEPLSQTLQACGWRIQTGASQMIVPDATALPFVQSSATLVLTQHAFNDCLHQAAIAIAMAGTATEQFVGLGKPAIIMPGQGPQFTPAFAEAQTRLLGPSVRLVEQPAQVPQTVKALMDQPDLLHLIAENGYRRMGQAGAAHRIATCLQEKLIQ